MKSNWIKSIQNLSRSDTAVAGGKGASLGELTRVGIPVPDGFVVLTRVFDIFLAENNLKTKIDRILKKADKDDAADLENISIVIAQLILDADITEIIGREILAEYRRQKLGLVAVRSSATAEDSTSDSWAGELESYLNVSENNLLKCIQKCWASIFTARAIMYRLEKGLAKKKVSVAVVVQKMVQAEISGTCFTVHPVTEDKNQLVIEAGYGLGEAVVGGMITPDTYVVDKHDKVILDKNITTQETMITRHKTGTKNISVPQNIRNKQKMSEKQIVDLTNVCMNIEKHYGVPQDIEWTMIKNKFFIVQSRPITTLSNIDTKQINITTYVKNQDWFGGVRREERLLYFSARRERYDQYLIKEIGIPFAENMLVPIKKDYPVRAYNTQQAKEFHDQVWQKAQNNPKIIFRYLKLNEKTWSEIGDKTIKLINACQDKNIALAKNIFENIAEQYEEASAQFIILFSIGMQMTKNKNKIKNTDQMIKKHDQWRNTITYKEEKLERDLKIFWQYITDEKRTKINLKSLIKYLTLYEFEKWMNDNISNQEIRKKIRKRNKSGYVYTRLREFDSEIVENKKTVSEIAKCLVRLIDISNKGTNKTIIGEATFSDKKPIRGRVVLIKTIKDLNKKINNIKNKILVTIQTTPHYIPYLAGVKAIVTDEGGITSHAAIISREMRIPCIVGTKNATKKLKDGDLIEMNTNTGMIRIISK